MPDQPPEALRCLGADVVDCFVPIPASTWLQGAQGVDAEAPGYDPDAGPEEGPPRQVTVSAFWMMRAEATVGLYRRCVRAGACSVDALLPTGGFSTWYDLAEPDSWERDAFPITSVSWQGAHDACAWLGGRLPTEAEWELAARGTDGWRWPWGNLPRCAVVQPMQGVWYLDSAEDACVQERPVSVTSRPQFSPMGVAGTVGNVWEWTADWFAPTLPPGPVTDPQGPASGTARAQRGGGWTAASPQEQRTTVRAGMDPHTRVTDVGFRCAW